MLRFISRRWWWRNSTYRGFHSSWKTVILLNLFYFLAPATTTNVIRQGSKALPTLDDRNTAKKTNGDNNRFASKGGNAIDKERIINIDTL